MQKLFLLAGLISFSAFAQLPTNANEVEVIKAEDELTYEYIPKISKIFRGARDIAQREELQKECQEFVMIQLKKAEAPYFKVWCTLTKDIVIREYSYTANLLIRSWQ